MSELVYVGINVAISASAGVRGIPLLRTRGRGNARFVGVPERGIFFLSRIRCLTIFAIANCRFRAIFFAGRVVIAYVAHEQMPKLRANVRYCVRRSTTIVAHRRFRAVLRASRVAVTLIVCITMFKRRTNVYNRVRFATAMITICGGFSDLRPGNRQRCRSGQL